ncbi:MAG: lipopolysaccharide biosynthesis protein RfbH [Bdellovibrionales bacterium]|nr:lipopolysaccharide biosynthesis protein RfbH [Bdellovibrionales bacterium]
MKELKEKIFELVKEYYQQVHAPHNKQFIAGKSRIGYAGRVFDQEEMLNLTDAALDFWLTHADYTEKFEDQLQSWLGVRFAQFVNSGSSANLLAFMSLTSSTLDERRINRGDEIITVAAGFPTTVAPIMQYGAVPVFVDVDLETANVQVSKLEEAIGPRTKAVMIAHTLGNPFDLVAVKELCDKHQLWLIEDNCDALGAKFQEKLTGTWGDFGTSSFYPAHHITTGEGGAVYTNDTKLFKIARSIRNWGRDCWCVSGVDNTCGTRFAAQHGELPFGFDHKYVFSHFGYNLKASDLQAAIGCAQIAKLDSFVAKRNENFERIYAALEGFSDRIILPRATPNSQPSWFGFLMTIRDGSGLQRAEIVQALEESGIQTRNLFAGNLVRQPCFVSAQAGTDYRLIGELTNTDKIMKDSFWIGVYPGLREVELEYMIEHCKKAFSR